MAHCFRKLILSVSFLAALLIFWLTPVAIASADSSVIEDPKTAFRQGVTAFQSGDYSLAAERFTQAVQLDPGYTSAYSNRCLTYLELKAYQNAIDDCTQALTLNSSNTEVYLNRGLAYYRSSEYAEAIADYTELLKLRPHDYRAHYNRGLAQVDKGAYREAIVDFGEALRQTSPLDRVTKAEIYNDRGLAQLLFDHPQQAIADLTQAIQLSSNHTGALYNRGCAYHQRGNYTAAVNDFTQVLQRVPNHAQAYLSRGMIRHELGEQSAAIVDLQQAAQYFQEQGLMLPYQQTLGLIERIRLPSVAFG